MARVNLSLPDEMKAKMDSFPSINWSAVAQEAFKSAITIADMRQNNMNDQADIMTGLERLRADRSADEEWNRVHGEELGRSWALKTASFATLVKVAKLEDQELPEDGFEAAAALYSMAEGDSSPSARDIEGWVIRQDLIDGNDVNYIVPLSRIEGFIAGAAEVYQQV